jgi:hypothetical protein
MSNFIKSYQANVGLNHVPAYQVSGQPFATSSVDASTAASISFPYVTRWFQVINKSTSALKVGFSSNGVSGTNYFTVSASGSVGYGTSDVLELKVSEIWLLGSADVDVIAGLTSIPVGRTTTDSGPSWSGSAGVG